MFNLITSGRNVVKGAWDGCRPGTAPEAAEKCPGHHEIFRREEEVKVS